MSGTDWELTPNYGLYKPFIDADDDQWGTHLNLNSDVLDTELFNVAQSLGNYLPLSGGTLTGPASTTSTFTFGGTTNNQPAKIGAGDGGVSYLALGAIGQNISWCVSAGVPYIFQNGVAVGGVVTTSSLSSQLGNYLPLAGGQLSGPLISSAGSSPTSPGLGIGDNATGFRRSGANTLLAVGGGDTMQFGPTATQALQPFLLSADATQPLQAVTYQQLMAHAFVDAPSDGFLYGRENAAWMRLPPGIADAPTDGHLYARSNANWSDITAANAASPNNTGRNLIHNPLFNIAQRGAGPFTANGAYTADRWAMYLTNDTLSVTQVAVADADRSQIGDEACIYAVNAQFTGSATAGSYSQVSQHIENVRRFSGKTVTVSFYARYTIGTPKVGVGMWQNFGTGGSPSASVFLAGQAVTLTAPWTRYSVTFNMPSSAGKTFGTNGNDFTALEFWFSDSGSLASRSGGIGQQSGTIQLWGVQLEIGSVATPLAKRDPEQELALCQRFYELQNFYMGGGATSAGLGYSFTMPYLVPKRAVPTITASNVSITNLTSAAVTADGATNVQVYGASIAAGGYIYQGTLAASADL